MKLSLRILLIRATTACVALFASIAFAHHSAASFDFTKPVTVEGVVKRFEVVNPHTRATITVTDVKGTRDVDFEGHSASNFFRAGYNRDSVKVGEHITILIAPRKDGKDGGFIVSFRTQNGQTIGFGNLVPGSGQPKESTTQQETH
jgi:hypothetical protein